MQRKVLFAKIHRATVTQCDPDYVGSITIDAELLRASGIRPNEAVSVYDIDNAVRFETYVIHGDPGSGIIGLNGAAAKLVDLGDRIIIAAYAHLDADTIEDHESTVVVADEDNRIEQVLHYPSGLDAYVKV